MKRDFLKGLGIEDNSVIDKILDENGADLSRERSKFGDYETVKGELKTAQDRLKGFEGVDVAELTKQRDDYKAQLDAAEDTKNKELNALRLDHAIDTALTKAGARSSKAVRALLDADKIELADGKISGLEEQLSQLKKDSGFLFESAQPPFFSGKSGGGRGAAITKEDFAKMGYNERLAVKQENPEAYKSLTE